VSFLKSNKIVWKSLTRCSINFDLKKAQTSNFLHVQVKMNSMVLKAIGKARRKLGKIRDKNLRK